MNCRLWDLYGVLSLPFVFMIPFGQFGVKLKQLRHKSIAIIINIVFVTSYIFCFSLGVDVILRHHNLKETCMKVLFNIGFTVVIIVLFSVWAFKCFKKFNFLCLVDQIRDTRSHSLNIKDVIYILFVLCCAGTVLILMNLNFYLSDHYDATLGYFKNGLRFMYISVSWALILNTSFSLCCVAIVLSREFKECVNNVQNNLSEENYFPEQVFHETAERFRKLTCAVDQVDAMFSCVVGLVLSSTLGMLCGATYGFFNCPSENWEYLIFMCCACIIIILPPLTILNRAVSLFVSPWQKIYNHLQLKAYVIARKYDIQQK